MEWIHGMEWMQGMDAGNGVDTRCGGHRDGMVLSGYSGDRNWSGCRVFE